MYLGITQSCLSRLQMVQNAEARLLTGTKKRESITPVLISLHQNLFCYWYLWRAWNLRGIVLFRWQHLSCGTIDWSESFIPMTLNGLILAYYCSMYNTHTMWTYLDDILHFLLLPRMQCARFYLPFPEWEISLFDLLLHWTFQKLSNLTK